MQVQAGAYSNAGQVRSINQDSYAVRSPRDTRTWDMLLVVADGMGGHQAGEIASSLAVEQVVEFCESTPASSPDLETTLRRAIARANETIRQAAAENRALDGMGTTLTAALVRDDGLYLGHVGDSRLYLLRKAAIYQLTQDHSWVAREVREGRLTAMEAERHPERHVLLQAVGGSSQVTADTAAYTLESGDVLLLCTDGLSNLVDGQELIAVTREFAQPVVAAERLVALANERGAPDNVTAVVARVLDRNRDSRATRELAPMRKHRWMNRKLAVAVIIAGAATLAGALYTFATSGLAHVVGQ
jgi:PPM family protein phosphatase